MINQISTDHVFLTSPFFFAFPIVFRAFKLWLPINVNKHLFATLFIVGIQRDADCALEQVFDHENLLHIANICNK